MSIALPHVAKNCVNVWFLGNLGYQSASRIQQLISARHFQSKEESAYEPNTLLLVEHTPVYTLGIRTSGYSESDETRLKALGAEFFKTNRGGLITFHGPGQLVAYPIINLKRYNKSMKWYVCKLEETVIQMCRSSFGFEAERSSDTGVWVDNKKICAIGVHGSRYVTTHGIGLNCDVDLQWFSHIVPCGIPDKGVTSLSQVLRKHTPVDCVIEPLLQSFSNQFSCTLQSLALPVKVAISNQLKLENLIDNKVKQQLLRDRELVL